MINITHHRYCIIGQPRCGSHHLESYIYNQLSVNNHNTIKIGEFLHWWSSRFSRFKLDNGTIINVPVGDPLDYALDHQHRIEMLKNSNKDQPIVARLFFTDNLLVNFKSLANIYLEAGFKLVYIKRKIDFQIISWYFSKDEKKWSLSIFENKKIIDIDLLKAYIVDYVKDQLYGERWLSTVEHECVDYEELSAYSSMYFKMMPDDPYSLIINKDEVKEVFTNYLPLVQRQLSSLIS